MDDGGPAFPSGESYTTTDLAGHMTMCSKAALKPGMSLLDWFAGQALAGILASNDYVDLEIDEMAACSRDAWRHAENMLAERKRRMEERSSPVQEPVEPKPPLADDSCSCGSRWTGIGVCPDCGEEHGRIM